jgi:hypothetical protein
MAHKNLPDKSQKVKDLLTLDLVRASKDMYVYAYLGKHPQT